MIEHKPLKAALGEVRRATRTDQPAAPKEGHIRAKVREIAQRQDQLKLYTGTPAPEQPSRQAIRARRRAMDEETRRELASFNKARALQDARGR